MIRFDDKPRARTSIVLVLFLGAAALAAAPPVGAEHGGLHAAIASPAAGETFAAGDAVAFGDASASQCEIVAWSWDFGDGATSEETAPVHIYTEAGEHFVTLRVTDACDEEDETQTFVAVVAGPLATIGLDGPLQVPAGGRAEYALSGADAYGNAVALAQETLEYEAGTELGPAVVSYEEDGIVGALDIEIVPGRVVTLAMTGPEVVVAGSATTWELEAYDAYDHAVALEPATIDAPTLAGPATMCHTVDDATACVDVEVVAAPLALILVTGPESVPVGREALFALAGQDVYGNSVPLAEDAMTWTAPTTSGATLACHTEQGVVGCAEVNALPGDLARIRILGPSKVLFWRTATFELRGYDAYGNDVPLQRESITLNARPPNRLVVLNYGEEGIMGSKEVQVGAVPSDRRAPRTPLLLPAYQDDGFWERCLAGCEGDRPLDEGWTEIPASSSSSTTAPPARDAGSAPAATADDGKNRPAFPAMLVPAAGAALVLAGVAAAAAVVVLRRR